MPCAVVTGSTSGIGLATANLLVQRGYSVVLHGHRHVDRLQAAAATLTPKLSSGCQLLCITADLAREPACDLLVRTCFHRFPAIDLWVNNAGADVLTGELQQLDFSAKLQRLWEVDVLGTIRLSRWVADRMQGRSAADRRGCIINLGWDQAWLGMEGEPGQLFGTIKSAVTAFTRSLSLSVAPWVRVNTVAPGWIRTAWGRETASSYWERRALSEAQLERWGTPEDVAETIGWLASPAAQFVNGQTIAVNGGRRYYPERGDQRPAR